MKKLVAVIGILMLLPLAGFAQPTNFTTSDYWKHQRKEILFGIGATNFLGDLGGLNRIGTDYSFIDLEWSTTRPSGHLGFRYRFRPWFATKTILQYGVLKGSDALTTEPARHNRNLSFRTHLIELSQHIEVVIYNNEHFGKRHSIKGLKGMRNKNTLVYLFSGITGFLYMPMAQGGPFLRPLRTEGQGLPGGPDKYGLFNYGIPFGMGCKIGLDALWRISFELSYTKTFTDYLDDVSTVYYDFAGNGYDEPAYADPSSGNFPTWTSPGEQRGDSKQKDAYFFFNVSLIRNVTYKRTRRIKWKYRARY
jgi:hypothetical protein